MKRLRSGGVLAAGMCVFLANPAFAQSSLEMLQKDLDQFKQEHQAVTSKNLEYFFGSLQSAQDSPQAAEKLYLDSGGKPPAPAKVITEYEHETPTEESARTALDQAAMASFDGTLQLHCGMLRFAALFATQPKLSSLQDDWIAWLKNASQLYPQIVVAVKDPRRKSSEPDSRPDVGKSLRDMAMNDSIIADYLGFHGWRDAKDQAKWRVSDIPKLYYDQILGPLRKAPTEATLAAWDVYIQMENADQPDQQTWTDVDYPALQFEKCCDDFASAPSTEKLGTLVALIKAHAEHPKVDDWISRVHDMIQSYQGQRSGGTATTSPSTEAPVPPDQPPPPAVVTPTR